MTASHAGFRESGDMISSGSTTCAERWWDSCVGQQRIIIRSRAAGCDMSPQRFPRGNGEFYRDVFRFAAGSGYDGAEKCRAMADAVLLFAAVW